MKKANFKKILALLISFMMVFSMIPSMVLTASASAGSGGTAINGVMNLTELKAAITAGYSTIYIGQTISIHGNETLNFPAGTVVVPATNFIQNITPCGPGLDDDTHSYLAVCPAAQSYLFVVTSGTVNFINLKISIPDNSYLDPWYDDFAVPNSSPDYPISAVKVAYGSDGAGGWADTPVVTFSGVTDITVGGDGTGISVEGWTDDDLTPKLNLEGDVKVTTDNGPAVDVSGGGVLDASGADSLEIDGDIISDDNNGGIIIPKFNTSFIDAKFNCPDKTVTLSWDSYWSWHTFGVCKDWVVYYAPTGTYVWDIAAYYLENDGDPDVSGTWDMTSANAANVTFDFDEDVGTYWFAINVYPSVAGAAAGDYDLTADYIANVNVSENIGVVEVKDCGGGTGGDDDEELPDEDGSFVIEHTPSANDLQKNINLVTETGTVNYVIAGSIPKFTAFDVGSEQYVTWTVEGSCLYNPTDYAKNYVRAVYKGRTDVVEIQFCEADILSPTGLTIVAILRDKDGTPVDGGLATYKVKVVSAVPDNRKIVILAETRYLTGKDDKEYEVAFTERNNIKLMAHENWKFKAKADIVLGSGDEIRWSVIGAIGNTGFGGLTTALGPDVTFRFCHATPIGNTVTIRAELWRKDAITYEACDEKTVIRIAGIYDDYFKNLKHGNATVVLKRGVIAYTYETKYYNSTVSPIVNNYLQPEDGAILWDIKTPVTSAYTMITNNGVLIVGPNETATSITVRAILPNGETAELAIDVDAVYRCSQTWKAGHYCPVCHEKVPDGEDECKKCTTKTGGGDIISACTQPDFFYRCWAPCDTCPACPVGPQLECRTCGGTKPTDPPVICPPGVPCDLIPCDKIIDLTCPPIVDCWYDHCYDLCPDFLVMLNPCNTDKNSVDIFWKTQDPIMNKVDKTKFESHGIVRDYGYQNDNPLPDSIFYICASVDDGTTWQLWKHWDYLDEDGDPAGPVGTQDPWDKYIDYLSWANPSIVLGENDVGIDKLLAELPADKDEIIFRLYVGNVVGVMPAGSGDDCEGKEAWAITSTFETTLKGLKGLGTGGGTTSDADKDALKALVKVVDDLAKVVDKSSIAGWDALQAALDKAKEVLADDNATQAAVDKALDDLQKALDNLKIGGKAIVAGDIDGNDAWNNNDAQVLFKLVLTSTPLTDRQMIAFAKATGYVCTRIPKGADPLKLNAAFADSLV